MKIHSLLFVAGALVTSLCCSVSTGMAMEQKPTTVQEDAGAKPSCWKSLASCLGECWACCKCVGAQIEQDLPVVLNFLENTILFLVTFQQQHPVAFNALVALSNGQEVSSTVMQDVAPILKEKGCLDSNGLVDPIMKQAVQEMVQVSVKRGIGEPVFRVITLEEYHENKSKRDMNLTNI